MIESDAMVAKSSTKTKSPRKISVKRPPATTIEKRLVRVERELAEIKAEIASKRKQPWWQEIAGSFRGDPVFAEIARLGAEIRRADGKGDS